MGLEKEKIVLKRQEWKQGEWKETQTRNGKNIYDRAIVSKYQVQFEERVSELECV